jgi:hypothetical protein
VLPPVELLKLGNEYWVVDGHNRIGAALRGGSVAVDADVTELLPPGVTGAAHVGSARTAMVGSEELRQAGEGRISPRSEMLRGGPSRAEMAGEVGETIATDNPWEAGDPARDESHQ